MAKCRANNSTHPQIPPAQSPMHLRLVFISGGLFRYLFKYKECKQLSQSLLLRIQICRRCCQSQFKASARSEYEFCIALSSTARNSALADISFPCTLSFNLYSLAPFANYRGVSHCAIKKYEHLVKVFVPNMSARHLRTLNRTSSSGQSVSSGHASDQFIFVLAYVSAAETACFLFSRFTSL